MKYTSNYNLIISQKKNSTAKNINETARNPNETGGGIRYNIGRYYTSADLRPTRGRTWYNVREGKEDGQRGTHSTER